MERSSAWAKVGFQLVSIVLMLPLYGVGFYSIQNFIRAGHRYLELYFELALGVSQITGVTFMLASVLTVKLPIWSRRFAIGGSVLIIAFCVGFIVRILDGLNIYGIAVFPFIALCTLNVVVQLIMLSWHR